MKRLATLLILLFVLPVLASNGRYRLILTDNPATTVMIGWEQTTGTSPVVYYGTTDYGTSWSNYPNTKSVDRAVNHSGMNNNFAKLSGLSPDTNYYFVIRDSQGTSQRLWFKTAPADNSRMSFISGGDSRNNRTPRQNANSLVSKLKPNAVFFGGDMTDDDTDAEWQDWMDDWQLTTASDGRMFPIVPARGNHERSNNSIYNLFNVPSTSVYYRLVFGANLYSLYTLNSEITAGGSQSIWLNGEASSDTSIWKSAQYHKPMRPHLGSKSEGNDEYNNWSDIFYNTGFNLVFESDSHVVKSTWPLVPCSGGVDCDQGFKRDDTNGTTYVGEGCWGAPLRNADDNKDWTRNSASFNQFKWIWVEESKIEVRTINVNNASDVGSVSNNNPFTIPSNLNVWNPSNGSVVTIQNSSVSLPQVSFTNPVDGAQFALGQNVSIETDASDADGSIASVEFYVNGTLVGTDSTAPYSQNWIAGSAGSYSLQVTAIDNNGNMQDTAPRTVYVGQVSTTATFAIASGNDDVEESEAGVMYENSSDLELVFDTYQEQNNQHVGLLFRNVSIPENATITNAYIQFTVDEVSTGSANLNLKIENTGNAADITSVNNNISSRNFLSQTVSWSPIAWPTANQTGVAQRTANVAALVQNIVNRGDWQSGNKMLFEITGTGTRTAESYDGSASNAPKLVVAYTVGSTANIAPSVSITSPTDGSQLDQGETVSITASASDSNGTIAEVQFYLNGSLETTLSSAPYSFNWTASSAGTYTWYAVATDNDGASTTSSSSIITILETGNSCDTTIANFPYNQSFEAGDAWTQATGDDGNWVNDASGTPSSNTGPSGGADGSFYMFLEASSNNSTGQIGSNATAILESPCFDLSNLDAASVTFENHMYGNNVGSLVLEASTDESTWTALWSDSGNQGNQWNEESVSLKPYLGAIVRLRFVGTTGPGWSSDIAIDHIELTTDEPVNSVFPDVTKKYYIDSAHFDFRIAATGESESPYTTSTATTGEDVEWIFVAKGNGNWHIQRAAGGSLPRLRTDNSQFADMQGTAWSGTYTYYEFTEGYYDNSYFVTLPDGPSRYRRLQVNNSGVVRMVSEASALTWESIRFTEVGSIAGKVALEDTKNNNLQVANSAGIAASLADVAIYPNPAKELFYIAAANGLGTDLTVKIYDITGTMVCNQDYTQNGIDVSSLASGAYLVRIINTRSGTFEIRKLIKE